eukprot:6192761-Pleurochrysis_carterae.AAC.1
MINEPSFRLDSSSWNRSSREGSAVQPKLRNSMRTYAQRLRQNTARIWSLATVSEIHSMYQLLRTCSEPAEHIHKIVPAGHIRALVWDQTIGISQICAAIMKDQISDTNISSSGTIVCRHARRRKAQWRDGANISLSVICCGDVELVVPRRGDYNFVKKLH